MALFRVNNSTSRQRGIYLSPPKKTSDNLSSAYLPALSLRVMPVPQPIGISTEISNGGAPTITASFVVERKYSGRFFWYSSCINQILSHAICISHTDLNSPKDSDLIIPSLPGIIFSHIISKHPADFIHVIRKTEAITEKRKIPTTRYGIMLQAQQRNISLLAATAKSRLNQVKNTRSYAVNHCQKSDARLRYTG